MAERDDRWTDDELQAAVDAYRQMQQAEARGQKYVKKQVYRDLAEQFGRTPKSFEFRMQNISAVLEEIGEPWIAGLPPAANVGPSVTGRLRRMLLADQSRGAGAPLRQIRQWLINVAYAREKVFYSDLGAAFNMGRFNVKRSLAAIGHECVDRGEPILSSLVVLMKDGHCAPGIRREFGVTDDEAERQRVFAHWAALPPDDSVTTPDEGDAGDSLEQRAAKFARVAVRPAQAAFRKKVFKACGGRCVITGCDIRRALDAAHRTGRSWRKGHNSARDGYLLRKDLHALYDCGMLRINSKGRVSLEPDAAMHYAELDGRQVAVGAR